MIPCIGIFGKLFGHKMIRFVTKTTPPSMDGGVTGNSYAVVPIIEAATAEEAIVRCVRCGMKAE